MYKIILFLFLSSQMSGQIDYIVDTITMTHSDRYPVSAGEIFRYHYFVTNEDKILSTNQFNINKYEPFRRTKGKGINNKYYEIEKLLQIRCDVNYDFIFPFAFYKLEYESLFQYGLQIENNLGKLGDFGSDVSIVLNFYKNERAVHFIDLDKLEIKGSQFKNIEEITSFDRIELVIQNKWKETLRMNFILYEYR